MGTIKALYRDKHFFNGLIITILILFGLRIFYSIPTPGVNVEYFKSIITANAALGFMDILSGNGLSNISVMMLNITPYISASIIIQLLGNVFKRIHDMQHGMRDEQKKLENATIILGIVLAALEGTAIAIGYGQKGLFIDFKWYWIVIAVLTWCAGTAIASLLGKWIQDKYKLNGISLILVCNILAGYLADGTTLYKRFMEGKEIWKQIIYAIVILACILILFAFTYYVNSCEKPIKVQYASKSNFNGNTQMSEFPIKLCPGSVVPIIFASSLMSTPVLIASAFSKENALWARILSSSAWFNPEDWLPTVGVIIYILLIFGFSFFYADITLDAKEIAENFKKSGGVIPGIRPGKPTEQYLKKHIKSTVAIGAIALILIALVPIVISGLFGLSRIAFLGTSVIIVVGVVVEIKNLIQAHAQQGNYILTTGKGLF